MRKILANEKLGPQAQAAITDFHADIVSEVEKAVSSNDWVVVGMAQNQVVKKARQQLDEAGVKYTYLEYGSYFGEWKKRLAIKLWSGWPTFPQVFHKGVLIGGSDDLKVYLPTVRS